MSFLWALVRRILGLKIPTPAEKAAYGIKTFLLWLWKGNDGNHIKRTILLCLLFGLMVAVGILGFYIRHLWNLPRGSYPAAAAAAKK